MPTLMKGMSIGTCAQCKEQFSKSTISSHLATCSTPMRSDQIGKTFRLLVEGEGQSHYWMHLEIPAQATLENLDDFLRQIWLECCDHLSQFIIQKKSYAYSPLDSQESNLRVPLVKVLRPGLLFFHEYDFGSTTVLQLKVLSEQNGDISKKKVKLLARNNPPSTRCSSCGKEAAQVCGDCGIDSCKGCTKKHKCGEDMFMPLANSPRAGVCGYG